MRDAKISLSRHSSAEQQHWPIANNTQALSSFVPGIKTMLRSPAQLQQGLAYCHQIAMQAQLPWVSALFSQLVPIIAADCGQLGRQYLDLWGSMYNGQGKTMHYPDFSQRHSSSRPMHNDRLNEWLSNVERINRQKVQFFQDSLTEEDNRPNAQLIHKDLAEIHIIRSRVTQGQVELVSLADNRDKVKLFVAKYCNHQGLKSAAQFGSYPEDTRKQIEDCESWCRNFMGDSKPNNTPIQGPSQVSRSRGLNVLSKHLQTNDINRNPPNRQRHLIDTAQPQGSPTVNSHLSKDSHPQFYPMDKVNIITRMGNHQFEQFEAELSQALLQPTNNMVFTRFVPGFQSQSIQTRESRPRKKIFDCIPKRQRYIERLSQSGNLQSRSGIKSPQFLNSMSPNHLSQFILEKYERKRLMSQYQISRAPEWIALPIISILPSQQTYNRYRRNCFKKFTLLYQDQSLQIGLGTQKVSSSTLCFEIVYRNLTANSLTLQVNYMVSEKSFQIVGRDRTPSRFDVGCQDTTHIFGLRVLQFPLGISTLVLDIPFSRVRAQIPLPISILTFLDFYQLHREDFLVAWQKYIPMCWYGGRRFMLNNLVMTAQQLQAQIPQLVDLGRKANVSQELKQYSFRELGCLIRYQYYDLQVLLVISFNVDNLVTLQVLSCKALQEEEFIEYLMNCLQMLIEY